jgi:hypothetical protein
MGVLESERKASGLKCAVALVALLTITKGICSESVANDALNRLLTEEHERWSLLTYSQLYVYDRNEPVQHTGTVFLQIDSFALHGCELNIGVVVQDQYVSVEEHKRRFSAGTVRKQIGPRINTFHYSYQLSLKNIDAAKIDTVFARPRQLDVNTRLSCQEEVSCNLPWLRVTARRPSIQETRILNGFEDVNQGVNQMAIPMTSNDRASTLAKALTDATISCREI